MPVLADVPANPSGLDIIRFVDRIAASPTVRLDLNDGTTWGVNYSGTDLSPPPLKQAWASTLLADGERLNAAAYANRSIALNMDLMTSSQDTAGAELQKLWRELNRPTNFLMWQPNGASNPVFFRTIRSSNTRVTDYPSGEVRTVEVSIDAEPFGYGLQETLSAVSVRNDPDPFFTNPMYFDVPTPKGDVETPLYFKVAGSDVVSNNSQTRRLSAIAVRRGGTPSNVPFALQVEDMQIDVGSFMYADMVTGESQFRGALNANTNFDVNTNNWTGTGGTAVRDTGTTFGGSAGSLRITPNGVAATVFVESEKVNIISGRAVAVFAQVRCAVARSIEVGINWYDAANVFISASGAPASVTPVLAATFTFARGWGKPPANAAKASMYVSMTGTPPASHIMHVDNAQIGNASSVQVDMNGLSSFTRTVWTDAFPATPTVDARGTYRVFLRYRYMADGTNWNIDARLKWGRSPDRLITNPVAILPHYDQIWRYADLGLVQIPGGYDPVYDGLSGIETVPKGIHLAVEVVDGDLVFDDLKLDHLLLVPADDRLLMVRWPSHVDVRPAFAVMDSLAGQVYATNSTGEIETLPGFELAGGTPMISPAVSNRIFWVLDVGREAVAGFVADLNNTMNVTPYYWPRYLSVRSPS